MDTQNRQMNVFCLTGFILSLLAPVVGTFGFVFSLYRRYLRLMISAKTEITIMKTLFALAIALAVAGLILSIKGLRSSRSRGEKGRGLGILGIVFAGMVLAVASFLMLAVLTIPRESPPTGTTPAVNELIREED